MDNLESMLLNHLSYAYVFVERQSWFAASDLSSAIAMFNTASFLYCRSLTFVFSLFIYILGLQNLTYCLWIAVPHGESDEEIRDNRPSIEFSDLDDDLEEEY